MLSRLLRFHGCRLRLLVIAAIGLLSVSNCTHADDKDSKVKGLLKDRLAVLQEVVAATYTGYRSGSVPYMEVIGARQAANKAELDLCNTDTERIAVLEKRLAIAKEEVEMVQRLVSSGEVNSTDLLKARAKRLKVEVALERLKDD
jgi:outer membrane protein TolC